MTYKLIDTREKQTMTKKQEEAIVRAYERFQPEGSTHIKLPQREHLARSFRPSVCCEHDWLLMEPDKEGTANLQKTFEETDLGDRQTICTKCKALALWERGEIFAYDAIALAPQPEERPERKSGKPNRRERRP